MEVDNEGQFVGKTERVERIWRDMDSGTKHIPEGPSPWPNDIMTVSGIVPDSPFKQKIADIVFCLAYPDRMFLDRTFFTHVLLTSSQAQALTRLQPEWLNTFDDEAVGWNYYLSPSGKYLFGSSHIKNPTEEQKSQGKTAMLKAINTCTGEVVLNADTNGSAFAVLFDQTK